MTSEVVKQGRFYVGTFFQGAYGDASRPPEERSPECVLLIRDYTLRRGSTGKLRSHIKTDALTFPNEDTMVAAIEEGGWQELPPEADGNPRYLPAEFDPKQVA